jgi:hypothetical protein
MLIAPEMQFSGYIESLLISIIKETQSLIFELGDRN